MLLADTAEMLVSSAALPGPGLGLGTIAQDPPPVQRSISG
jgi:hypothetical protein